MIRQIAILISISCLWFNASAKTEIDLTEERLATTPSFSKNVNNAEYHYKDIDSDSQGYLSNTSSDSFITVSGFELTRSQACFFVLDARFKFPMSRPALFEIFWAVDSDTFSETQKGQFLINHKNTHERTLFVVPLCKLYSFSGNLHASGRQKNIVRLRFDYPSNRTVELQIHRMGLVSESELKSLVEAAQNSAVLEPYERVSGGPFLSFDVALPKLYFGLEDGVNRLKQDPFFLSFWLAGIFLSLVLLVKGRRKN